MTLLLLTLGCAGPGCDEGFAEAADGNCYPLAGNDGGVTVVDDTPTDTPTDDTGTTPTDTIDTPPPVQLLGSFAYAGPSTLDGMSICYVTLWDEADQTNGFPDPTKGEALALATVDCPTERDVPVPFDEDLYLPGPARVGAFGGIDLDGDLGTVDVAAGGTTDGNFDVEPGGTYPGVDIVTF